MTLRTGHITAAMLAGVLAAASAMPGGNAAAAPAKLAGRMILLHGYNAADVLAGRGKATTAARLRAAWLLDGHGDVSPQATQALAIRSGTVLSNTLRVGDPFAFPSVQFSFVSGAPGLAEADFTFTSTAGPTPLTVSYVAPGYATKGAVAFQSPPALPFYLAPGTLTLTGATLYDYSGGTVSYTADQLAAAFTSNTFTVINDGPVDSTPPVLGVGHLLTPTISLSAPHPALKVTLPVADSGTGVGFAILFLTPPGQDYAEGQFATIPLPVKSGTLSLYDLFVPGDPLGTWNFYEVQVCDVAGNCDTLTDKQAIFNLLGANSVTVTN